MHFGSGVYPNRSHKIQYIYLFKQNTLTYGMWFSRVYTPIPSTYFSSIMPQRTSVGLYIMNMHYRLYIKSRQNSPKITQNRHRFHHGAKPSDSLRFAFSGVYLRNTFWQFLAGQNRRFGNDWQIFGTCVFVLRVSPAQRRVQGKNRPKLIP